MKKYFKHWFRWITAILPRIYIIVRSLQENLFFRIKYILLVGFMSVIISCNHSDNNTYLNDIRDGEVYRIELLKDGRLWMTENLRYESHNSVCYDNNQSNCKIYGRLYNWGEAITACPDGWHLPSDQEWDTMANFYKSKSYKGKSKFSSSFENLIKSGKNDLGIQLGGLKTGDGGFDNKDIDGFYWSSTDTETGGANCYSFFSDLKIINRLSVDKGAYRSCRCIKDAAFDGLEKSDLKSEDDESKSIVPNINNTSENNIERGYDDEDLLARLKLNAENGDPFSQWSLGKKYNIGENTIKDKAKAFYWFQRAADLEYTRAMGALGSMYFNGTGTVRDKKKSLYWYKKAAEKGSPSSQWHVAHMYSQGFGTLKDLEQSFYWDQKAAENDFELAFSSLANKYYHGLGTLEDKEKAFYWYMKDTEKGNSLQNVAFMYFDGIGTLQDKKKAFYWLQKATEYDSNSFSKLLIAEMYYNGDGTLMDKEKAFYWFQKAAKPQVMISEGYHEAQFMLGYMYYEGEGTLMDKKKAAKWIRIAYENGSDSAKEFWEENELWKYE